MPGKYTRGNVRQLNRKSQISMAVGGEYAIKCVGLLVAAVLGEGVPCYTRLTRDRREALVRFYFPDDPAEGSIDLGPDVREEVAMLLEEAFTAELANRVYDLCGERPAEAASKAPNEHYRALGTRKGRNAPQNGAHEPTGATAPVDTGS